MLAAGKLVAFPTETVYGLGADAESDAAVASVYAAKGRPAVNPLIVHLADIALLERYAVPNAAALSLAERFWPGPLTLVLPRRPQCPASAAVSAGRDSIAVRIPAHPLARALLEAFGRGIAAPSANRSGRVSPTAAAHVAAEFAGVPGVPAMLLDGGASAVGIESTVLDCTGDAPVMLRAGSVTEAELHGFGCRAAGRSAEKDTPLPSPGMLESHYAPRARVRMNATQLYEGEALLEFGRTALHAAVRRNLSPSGNLEEAAHRLYALLRELDASGAAVIAVTPIPEEGIGIALNDRLRRASAPRPARPGSEPVAI